MSSQPTVTQHRLRWQTAVIWLLLAAGIGWTSYGLLTVDLYQSLPEYRFRDLLWLALGAAVLAAPIAWLTRIPGLVAWTLALLTILVAGLNLGQTLSVLALAVSAWSLGSVFVADEDQIFSGTRIVLGLALIAGLLGWLLPYPLHTRLSYVLLILLPILWQRKRLGDTWAVFRANARVASSALPTLSHGLAALALTLIATAAWMPVLMSDDLVYHLGLPTQLLQHGHYLFNLTDQIWATSPWAGDVLHAVVMLLSGQVEIGALNALWLILAASLMWRVLRLVGCDASWAALGTGLFFSVPLFHLGAMSMQTELASTAAILALVERILQTPALPSKQQMLVIAILSAFLLALKVSNVTVLAPALVWWLLRHRPLQWRPWLPAIALGFLVAGSSYTYAWLLTGNPALPLFNGLFQSPLMPAENFSHETYRGLLSLDVLFQVTFDSSRFMESDDGSFGFQWLALCGLLPVIAFARTLRPMLWVGLIGVLALFLQMQYLRYLLPALAILAVPLTASLASLRPAFLLKGLATGMCLLNLYFACQAAPPLHAGTVTEVLRHGLDAYRTAALRETAPERLLLASWQTRLGPHATVFAGTTPNVAELAGRGHFVSWTSGEFWQRMPALETDITGNSYLDHFRTLGVDHILLRPEFASPALMAALDQQATLLDSQGAAMLYRLNWPTYDLTENPSVVLPNQSGIVQRYPVDRTKPWIATAEVQLRCAKKGWGVAVTHVARGSFGERVLDSQINFCGQDHILSYRVSAALPLGSTEGEIQIQTYTPDNPLNILEAKAWLRPDAMRTRDQSAALRLF